MAAVMLGRPGRDRVERWVQQSPRAHSRRPRTSSRQSGHGLLVVSRSAAPVPSAACHQRFSAPPRSELKMIRRPSGVHRGRESWPGSSLRRVSVARRRSQIKRSASCSLLERGPLCAMRSSTSLASRNCLCSSREAHVCQRLSDYWRPARLFRVTLRQRSLVHLACNFNS
jgi:hypothetical protein